MRTCKRGHPFEGNNLYLWRGKRNCRACQRLREKRAPSKEKIAQRTREYRRRNPERTKLLAKQHRKNSQASRLACEHRRRARKLNQLGSWILPEPEFMRLLWSAQDGRCFYCLDSLDDSAEQDHKVPLSRGGFHSSDNVCWACAPCNRSKYNQTHAEFLERKQHELQ